MELLLEKMFPSLGLYGFMAFPLQSWLCRSSALSSRQGSASQLPFWGFFKDLKHVFSWPQPGTSSGFSEALSGAMLFL